MIMNMATNTINIIQKKTIDELSELYSFLQIINH